jgi:4-hydroxymandelate oxidase
MIDVNEILSLREMEERAREVMPHMAYEFIASGAGDEITVRWNREAFDKIALRPRVLTGIDAPDMSVNLLGRMMTTPIMLAPTAYHRVLHPEGEIATARGAGAAGVTWIVSSASTTPVEEIAKAASGPLWFQLYVQSDREFTKDVAERAIAAGCEALCVTVDTPVLGARHRQKRAAFALPDGVRTPHLRDTGSDGRAVMDPKRVAVTWKDIEWLKSLVKVPIVLKGIMDADDADTAVSAGANALIVSNHGGRNLDTAPATIDALPKIASRVAERVPILVDGGISNGTDVIKALARGAAAILIGRPYCYGLSLAGADGVTRAVAILRDEVEMAMMFTGHRRIAELNSSSLFTSA